MATAAREGTPPAHALATVWLRELTAAKRAWIERSRGSASAPPWALFDQASRRASSATPASAASRDGSAPPATRPGSRPRSLGHRLPDEALRRRLGVADERGRSPGPAHRRRRLPGRRLGALGAHDGGAARPGGRRARPHASRGAVHGLRRRACAQRRKRRFAPAFHPAPRSGSTSTSSARSAIASSGAARTGKGSRRRCGGRWRREAGPRRQRRPGARVLGDLPRGPRRCGAPAGGSRARRDARSPTTSGTGTTRCRAAST